MIGTWCSQITCHLHLCHIMCIRRWNSTHQLELVSFHDVMGIVGVELIGSLTLLFFFLPFFIPFPKGFKLRSLSLSPSCMRGFQSHFVRNWWRWDAKANYRINRTHMFCSTSGTLMAQSLSLTYFSIFVEVTPHTNSIATPINLYHNTYYKLSTYSAQPHQLLFLEKL